MNSLKIKIRNDLSVQLHRWGSWGTRVEAQLRVQLRGQLWVQLQSQLKVQLGDRLWVQLHDGLT